MRRDHGPNTRDREKRDRVDRSNILLASHCLSPFFLPHRRGSSSRMPSSLELAALDNHPTRELQVLASQLSLVCFPECTPDIPAVKKGLHRFCPNDAIALHALDVDVSKSCPR